MPKIRYQPLGPLLAGEGSRAFMGLEITEGAPPRPVVLVWVPEELAKDPDAAAKIARETKRAASLEHPNIIKVYGLTSLDEGLARVVEFADGESLRKVLDVAKKLPPRLAALVTADAAMGAHYAHVAGNDDGTPLVHGDIRPETLMVSFSGVCKVGGYGALGVAPKEQGGKRVQGRRYHCAPEQILGGRDAVNRQTDVYLLGLVLYECLTGDIPFKDDPRFDDAVLYRPLPPLLPEDVPPDLIRVVEQATAKKAADRFPTTRALRDATERAVQTLPAHEELAAFLRNFFPENSPARNARRQEIEAGLAELARREPDRALSATPPVGPAMSERVEPISLEIRKPIRPAEQLEKPPLPFASAAVPKERSIATYIVPVLLILGGLGYWYLDGSGSPSRQASPAASAKSVAPEAKIDPSAASPGSAAGSNERTAPIVQDAVAASTEGSAETGAAVRPAVAKGPAAESSSTASIAKAAFSSTAPRDKLEVNAQEKSRANADDQLGANAHDKPGVNALERLGANAHDKLGVNSDESSLELTVEPPVEIAIDGRTVGRSPLNVAVSPGKHVLQLTDRSRGINVSRTVQVGAKGKTSQRLVIAKGVVEVTAPDGATIYIDGRPVGKAPLKEIPVFEGKHRILATFGSAKWQQGFTVGANEHMSFKIEATDP